MSFLRDPTSLARRAVLPTLPIVCAILLIVCSRAFSSPDRNSSATSEAQLFKQAQELTSEGRLRDAAGVYNQIVQLDSGSFAALNNLGVIDSHLGDYKGAAAAYERALSLRPGSFAVLMNLGIAHFKESDFNGAVQPLTRAVALQPQNFQALALLSLTQYSAKDFTGACRHLERAVALSPGNPTLEYMLGESYLRTGQEQKLVDRFSTMAQPSATDRMLLGAASDAVGRTQDAIREFTLAASSEPDALCVHFGLGFLYWKEHDDLRAAGQFGLEMEDAGWVPQSEAYLGDIDLRRGKRRESRAMLEQALRLNPDLSLAHLDLGILDALDKSYGDAAAEFEKTIRLDPKMAEGYRRLAQVYAAEGKPRLAASATAQANSLKGERPESLAEKAALIPPP
ncbi:MAG: tetratricopeptide repeat protein [Terriglobia bacterium]